MDERIIIYTAITGAYDSLPQPFQPAEGFEFICFVEKGAKKSERDGVWRIEEIPFSWSDMTLLARSQKLNPHTSLPEDSRWSLWIDGNIRITDDSLYRICRELQKRDVKLAGVKHPFRDCPYEETLRCLADRRESLWKLLRLVRFLRRNNVPEHAGLMETNIIFRKHNDPTVVEFDRWWWECLVKFSNRDQLTQTFALLDTSGLEAEYIFPDGVSSRNFKGVEYVRHPAPELSFLQRKLKYGLNKPKLFMLRSYISLTRRCKR
mgnify:CR=1 FL=1